VIQYLLNRRFAKVTREPKARKQEEKSEPVGKKSQYQSNEVTKLTIDFYIVQMATNLMN
jgi:hypothetical protein